MRGHEAEVSREREGGSGRTVFRLAGEGRRVSALLAGPGRARPTQGAHEAWAACRSGSGCGWRGGGGEAHWEVRALGTPPTRPPLIRALPPPPPRSEAPLLLPSSTVTYVVGRHGHAPGRTPGRVAGRARQRAGGREQHDADGEMKNEGEARPTRRLSSLPQFALLSSPRQLFTLAKPCTPTPPAPAAWPARLSARRPPVGPRAARPPALSPSAPKR